MGIISMDSCFPISSEELIRNECKILNDFIPQLIHEHDELNILLEDYIINYKEYINHVKENTGEINNNFKISCIVNEEIKVNNKNIDCLSSEIYSLIDKASKLLLVIGEMKIQKLKELTIILDIKNASFQAYYDKNMDMENKYNIIKNNNDNIDNKFKEFLKNKDDLEKSKSNFDNIYKDICKKFQDYLKKYEEKKTKINFSKEEPNIISPKKDVLKKTNLKKIPEEAKLELISEMNSQNEYIDKLNNKDKNDLTKDINNDIGNKNNNKKINKEFYNKSKTLNNQLLKENKLEPIYDNNLINLSKSRVFLQNSMLMGVNNFTENGPDLNTEKIFNNFTNNNIEEVKYKEPTLVRSDIKHFVTLKNNCDMHDIQFTLTAKGLKNGALYPEYTITFEQGNRIELVEFEVNKKKLSIIQIFDKENSIIKFDINLCNDQNVDIHYLYFQKKIEEEREEIYFSNYVKLKEFNLNKNLNGQKYNFELLNESEFDIINVYENCLIAKHNQNIDKKDDLRIKQNYYWKGIVPSNGHKIKILMSKKKGIYSYTEYIEIKSKEKNKLINNLKLYYPINFNENLGNITSTKISTFKVNPFEQNKVTKTNLKGIYNLINFTEINANICSLLIKGNITNEYLIDWKVNLTDEEIEKYIPTDFKNDIKELEKIADEIILDYNRKNEGLHDKVLDIRKIGEWITKNIKYDLSLKGTKEINALKIYKNKRGDSHHITTLFNALLYAKKYKVIYCSGYLLDKATHWNSENSYSWTLVNISGHWKPFDATMGIFTGKLPVSHIFKNYVNRGDYFIKAEESYSITQIKCEGEINL